MHTRTTPDLRCLRCNQLRSEHTAAGADPRNGRRCSDGAFFRNKHQPPTRTPSKYTRRGASQSFSETEIVLLDSILVGLLSKKDLSILIRSSAFTSVLRKVNVMKATVACNIAEAAVVEAGVVEANTSEPV
jgi:hypothetical protein